MTAHPTERLGSRAGGILWTVVLSVIALALMPMILYVWIKSEFDDVGRATIPLIVCMPAALLLLIEIARKRWRQVQGIIMGLAGVLVILFALMLLMGSMLAGAAPGVLAG